MNDQSPFKGFGAPQQQAPTALSRLMPRMRTLAAGGAAITLAFLLWQKAAPDGWRPADIAGAAAGAGERHEVVEKQAAVIAYERGKADAVAQANAKAQTDVIAIQKALEARSGTYDTESGIANLADAFCLGGMFLGALGSQNTGADVHNGAVTTTQLSCGVGDKLRQEITRSQIAAVREAAAARGAPMVNGATAPR